MQIAGWQWQQQQRQQWQQQGGHPTMSTDMGLLLDLAVNFHLSITVMHTPPPSAVKQSMSSAERSLHPPRGHRGHKRTTSNPLVKVFKQLLSFTQWFSLNLSSPSLISGGSRNLEREVQQLAHETHPTNFWIATPTSGTLTHS